MNGTEYAMISLYMERRETCTCPLSSSMSSSSCGFRLNQYQMRTTRLAIPPMKAANVATLIAVVTVPFMIFKTT